MSCLLRDQEEVETLIGVLILDKLGVNDTSRWWILHCLSVSALDEHPLVDSLVHDDESDLRRVHLVVERLDSFLELLYLFVNDLRELSFTNSVSVDDDLVWQRSIVLGRETSESVLHALVEVLSDEFLALWLDDDVTVGTCALSVVGGDETNDGLLSSVTDINSDDHNVLLGHESRVLDPNGLSSHLAVDLLHYICGHREIDFSGCKLGYDLSHHVLLGEDALVLGVVVLLVQDDDSEDFLAFLQIALDLLEVLDQEIRNLVEVSANVWKLENFEFSRFHLDALLAVLEIPLRIFCLVS